MKFHIDHYTSRLRDEEWGVTQSVHTRTCPNIMVVYAQFRQEASDARGDTAVPWTYQDNSPGTTPGYTTHLHVPQAADLLP